MVRQPKARAKTVIEQQLEYFEPEEDTVFANLSDKGGFKEEFIEPSGMPQFGDRDMLSKLEKLSNEPTKPVRARRTKATTTTTTTKAPARKPRTKK